MEDERIIDLFFARSGDAVAELDRKYGISMIKISKNILQNGSDAEECLNDAYLAVWNSIPPARPEPLSAYVHKVIRNVSLKRYRGDTAAKRDRRNTVSLEEIGDALRVGAQTDDAADSAELTGLINSFLSSLDRTNLYVFMRKYWYFDSADRIAEKLGITEASVYMRLDRMKKKLKKHLEQNGVTI